MRSTDYVGKIIGKYKILEYIGPKYRNNIPAFRVLCTLCGEEFIMTMGHIKRGAYVKNCKRHYFDRNSYYIGKTIGDYTILEYVRKTNSGHDRIFKVRCNECGNVFEKSLGDIVRAKNKNFILCRKCKPNKPRNLFNKKINTSGHNNRNKRVSFSKRLRKIYSHMIDRCYDPKDSDYSRYGERGITICDEWKDDYFAFEDWALANGYNDNLTIERIDGNKGYSPENCQWKSFEYNAKFKDSSLIIHIKSSKFEDFNTLTGWMELLNLHNIRYYMNKIDDPELSFLYAIDQIVQNLPSDIFDTNEVVVIAEKRKPIEYDFINGKLVKVGDAR